MSDDESGTCHYPVIDVSTSISRLMLENVSPGHRQLASLIWNIISVYEKNADLVAIGACKLRTNRKLDFAMSKIDAINDSDPGREQCVFL